MMKNITNYLFSLKWLLKLNYDIISTICKKFTNHIFNNKFFITRLSPSMI